MSDATATTELQAAAADAAGRQEPVSGGVGEVAFPNFWYASHPQP